MRDDDDVTPTEMVEASAPPAPVQTDPSDPHVAAVSMRQARLALLAAGLLDEVTNALASMPSPEREAALIEWEYGTSVERQSPLIAALGPALGIDDDSMDRLFAGAAML